MAERLVNREPDYKDLDLDFFAHPTTKDVQKKSGIEAIKRSVRNLIFTNFYDRPFQSYIGSDVRALLFENANPFTAVLLQDAITLCLQNFEPRVKVQSVVVSEDIDNLSYNVRLEYIILNKELPVIQTIFLERIR
jgi:phage baseplate assembly protein W